MLINWTWYNTKYSDQCDISNVLISSIFLSLIYSNISSCFTKFRDSYLILYCDRLHRNNISATCWKACMFSSCALLFGVPGVERTSCCTLLFPNLYFVISTAVDTEMSILATVFYATRSMDISEEALAFCFWK